MVRCCRCFIVPRILLYRVPESYGDNILKHSTSTKILLLTIILLSGGFSLGYAQDFPRHIDPNSLEVIDPSPSHLFGIYDLIFTNILNGDYDRARSILADAQDIEAGPKIDSLLNAVNGLLYVETDSLEGLRDHLSDAKSLLVWYKESDVEITLSQASEHLLNASETLDGLQETMLESIVYLKGYETELGDRFTSLEDIIGAYSEEVQLLAEQARLIAELKRGEDPQLFPTALSLKSNVTSSLLGSTVMLTGKLERVNGSGVSTETIYLYQDGLRVSEIPTMEDGNFIYLLKIPYLYRDTIEYHVEFWPREGSNLIPSLSNKVGVNLEFSVPVFQVDSLEPIRPGGSTYLHGKLLMDDSGLPGIGIKLVAFGSHKKTNTISDGSFSFEFSVPENVREGTHSLDLRSDPSYTTGPSEASVSILVVRSDIDISYESESWTLSGNYITVSGHLETGAGPLKGCLVVVRGDLGLYFTSSGALGEYSVDINIPDDKLSSLYSYTVYAVPSQGWLKSSYVNGSVFIFNVYFVTGIALSLVAAGTYWFILTRGRANWVLSESGSPQSIAGGPDVYAEPRNFYESAVNLISRIVGHFPDSSITIREYLGDVKSKLSVRMYSVFERLSLFYERLVYGEKKEVDTGEGVSLLDMLKEQADET